MPEQLVHGNDFSRSDLPAIVGPYQVQAELGRGGMGRVLQAWDPRLKRHVAVKQILGQQGPEELLRFRREAEVSARLKHPGIASVFEVVTEGPDAPYLVMDCVAGLSLQRVCESGLTGRRTAEIVRGVADALAHAHQRGVIHRDLKPQNVMVTPQGEAVVLDFGLARRVRDESVALTMTGDLLGTPAYMAPEQVAGEGKVDERTDVYGLGGILYGCLTGRPPFGAEGEALVHVLTAVRNDDPPAPRTLNPQAHRDLETICLKCLEKDPNQRYASAAEVADELGRFLDGEPIRAVPLGKLQLLRRRLRRHKALVAVALLGVLVALGLIPFAASQVQRAEEAETERRQLQEADLAYLRSRRQYELGDFAGSVATLTSLIDMQPDRASAYYDRGQSRLLMSDGGGAQSDFEVACRLDPRLIGAHQSLANVRVVMGDMEGARAALDRGLKENPDSFLLHMERAGQRRGVQDREGALLDYHRAAELNPSWAPAHLDRAMLLSEMGRAEEAVEAFSEALPLLIGKGGQSRLLFQRGLARRVAGDPAGSEEDLSRSIELDPDWYRHYKFRAALRSSEGNDRMAALDLEQSLRCWPGQTNNELMRAKVQEVLGRPSKY